MITIFIIAGFLLIFFSFICFKRKRKIAGWILTLSGLFSITIGGTFIVVYFVIAPGIFEPAQYLQYQEQLASPDGKHIFVLFHDYSGIGDPSWHVFKFKKSVDINELKIPTDYTNEASEEHKKWVAKMLMWNWSEAGDHTRNSHIEIIGNSYLVFIRGNLYHGLYDIKDDKTLIEDHSPWHTYIYSDEYKLIKPEPSHEERKKLIAEWKQETLHQPISDIIQEKK